jgi:formamidopyrimidine-DNA glycosylase
MPELPEAEVIARHLRARVVGATIKAVWVGRPDIVRQGLETLDRYRDATITAVDRQGKSVFLSLARASDLRYLVAELGMTGLLLFQGAPVRHPQHIHLVLRLDGGQEPELRYWNPRRFGRIHLLDKPGLERFLAKRFGCDPLGVSWEEFRRLVGRRRGRLKTLLMHQQTIAGIGNIYANEILYRARLHPHHTARRLKSERVKRLYDVMREVLTDAISHGGSSVRDFIAPDGTEGSFIRHHLVYNRAGRPCPSGCGSRIHRLPGERTSFYCPACQRRR